MKRHLFLLAELVRRDLALRYAGSFGGIAWAVLHPLILCGLYSLVFSVIVRVPPPPDFGGGYTPFLLAGLIPWLGFSDALVRGASSVTDQAHIVKKLSFPVGLLVVSSIAGALLLQTAAIGVLVVVFSVLGVGKIHILPLLGAYLLEVLVLAGPVFALAAGSVLFRDLSQLIGPLLTVLFYLTPVLYPEALVPDALRGGLVLNPARDVVALFRAGLIGTEAPPVGRLLVWGGALAALAFLGRAFFERSRRVFVDVL